MDIPKDAVKEFKDEAKWLSFLKCASFHYKYSFYNQLLINAQNPNATALTTMDAWNQKLNRYVNRGANSILVIDDGGKQSQLKYVFDVNDTHQSKPDGREFSLWEIKEDQAEAVRCKLIDNQPKENFKDLDLGQTLKLIIENRILEDLDLYQSDLFDEENPNLHKIQNAFIDMLIQSTSYFVLSRCAIDAEAYFKKTDFKSISLFDNLQALDFLGVNVGNIAKPLLMQLGKIVQALNKEKEIEIEETKGEQHGNNISQRGGLQLPQSGADGTTERTHREIRGAETTIPDGKQKLEIPIPVNVGNINPTPVGYRPDSRDPDRQDHGGFTESKSGTGQSDAANGMGGIHEQSQTLSRGNRDGGTDLQLEYYEPRPEDTMLPVFLLSKEINEELKNLTDDEFLNKVNADIDWRIKAVSEPKMNKESLEQEIDHEPFVESRTSETSQLEYSEPQPRSIPRLGYSLLLYDVLREAPYLSATKQEITDFFRDNFDGIKRAEYMKSIFNIDSTDLTIREGKTFRNVGYEAYQKALIIWEIDKDDAKVELDYDWSVVSDHVADMILFNELDLVKESPKSNQLSMFGFSPNIEPSIPNEVTDIILEKGSGYENGIFRIYCLYQRNISPDLRAEFLENEYGSYSAHPIITGKSVNMYANPQGLHIEHFHTDAAQNLDVVLSWNELELFIGDLIQSDNYLADAEKDMLTDDFLATINLDLDWRIGEILKPREIVNQTPTIDNENADPQAEIQISTSADNKTENTNFHITDDKLGHGTAREKYHDNITAIKTLFSIEEESRMATPGEQQILSKYIGWGGLSQAFDDTNVHWTSEYAELKDLLSDEDYISARGSTLNAHYTSPTIIKAMYNTLSRMGFQKGNILEPAMGVGNFFGLVPDSMNQSKLYGVELDTISGRLATQLYPKANVFVGGFEETSFQNNFFDLAIGNVPFGSYKVSDKPYDKNNFLIHDYFFAKTLDKVRAGGVVAFITSKGTLDKKNASVRKYLAERAELIGAVRLPNNAFTENAGTQVTSDIIFLKKREHLSLEDQDWIHLEEDNGIPMNSYFVNNPSMILGEMKLISGPYGDETACIQIEGQNLGVELKKALNEIQHEFTFENIETILVEEEALTNTLPADPDVTNFSYTLVDDKIYFRNNSIMISDEFDTPTTERIKSMIEIRDFTRELINLQLNDYGDSAIKNSQTILNQLYDTFSKNYGLINSRMNKKVFSDDSSYCLLCSLEVLSDDGEFVRKADMFSKRTIKKHQVITEVDTSNEALILSISEKAKIDFGYMMGLTGKSKNEITRDLHGVIFLNPETEAWEPADEYLSGDVRSKLNVARQLAEHNPELEINVSSLEMSQPKDLEASEIEVRLGATWIEPHYIKSFMADLLQTPRYYLIDDIDVGYSKVTGTWNVKGKNADDRDNVYANVTYGTSRANGYKIIEDSLNLKDIQITDTVMDGDKKKNVINKDETILASQKQEMIKEAFRDWIFKDPDRREYLVSKYNTLFNSVRPREYDGSHVVLHGVSPEITLRPYQLNAIARSLYGGNTLLAHCVGAGKTFEMTSIAMESKYLGLAEKSMFVVPNHLIGQWGSEFLQLYPGANVLVSTAKDFQPDNRKKFCSRIATGDYDAVIIGHSQFEKIPLSVEYQTNAINKQVSDLVLSIKEAKRSGGENFTVKQMEKARKALELKMTNLNNTSRKDKVVTFEELGVDRLFIDEAHNYKNLFLHTKMRNVAGIGGSQAQKSTDMFNKCQYLDEKTGGKGVIFATGTPISNSMTELYTMMRYLQYHTLENMGLTHFDAWASSFAEPVTSVELSPEGGGYRSKTRLARFYNLPELMNVFKEVADVQTPDMLSLPIPKATFIDIVSKPSEHQKDLLLDLVDRAKAVRDKTVDTTVDNMLCITNDGRKLALDQRLINPLLPDNENSKVNACANNIHKVWDSTKEQKSAQLVFCDLSTPKKDGRFTVYGDLKMKAIALGIPEKEIAFIHDADTETKKDKLFSQVRRGDVRVLIGSTAKLGAGTNVQDLLVALHHLDVPWRPSDIEQQEGRILRQGNQNDKVEIFRYITEETFDAYSWQLIENKQKFIGQVMTSKSPGRSCEDVDEQALSYAEIKALATGNPYIKEKMDLDIKVMRLRLIKANHTTQQYRLEDNIAKHFPKKISMALELEKALISDNKMYLANKPVREDFSMTVKGKHFSEKKEAGQAILEGVRIFNSPKLATEIGGYCGFKMYAMNKGFDGIELSLRNKANYKLILGPDELGNIIRINNILNNIPEKLSQCKNEIALTYERLENAKIELKKPFAQEDELNVCLLRLKELNNLLSMEKTKYPEENDVDIEEERKESENINNKEANDAWEMEA